MKYLKLCAISLAPAIHLLATESALADTRTYIAPGAAFSLGAPASQPAGTPLGLGLDIGQTYFLVYSTGMTLQTLNDYASLGWFMNYTFFRFELGFLDDFSELHNALYSALGFTFIGAVEVKSLFKHGKFDAVTLALKLPFVLDR